MTFAGVGPGGADRPRQGLRVDDHHRLVGPDRHLRRAAQPREQARVPLQGPLGADGVPHRALRGQGRRRARGAGDLPHAARADRVVRRGQQRRLLGPLRLDEPRDRHDAAGFWGFNRSRGLRDYATSASMLASNHNMFYTDDRGNFGYWHPGNHPVRAKGVDLRLPQDGTGKSEWRGLLPVQRVPHAANFKRGWLVNWNNLPAQGLAARARLRRARRRRRPVRPVLPRARRPTRAAAASAASAGTSTHSARASATPRSPTTSSTGTGRRCRAPAELKTDLAKKALEVLARVARLQASTTDEDGFYDSAGYTLTRAWIPQLRKAAFEDELGEDDLGRARSSTEVWHVFSPRSRHAPAHRLAERQEPARRRGRGVRDGRRAAARRVRVRRPGHVAQQDAARALHAPERRPLHRRRPRRGVRRARGDLRRLRRPAGAGLRLAGRRRGPHRDGPRHLQPRDRVPHPRDAREAARRLAGPRGQRDPAGPERLRQPVRRGVEHFEDQLDDYVNWTYKPMPLSIAELEGQTESTETLAVPDRY